MNTTKLVTSLLPLLISGQALAQVSISSLQDATYTQDFNVTGTWTGTSTRGVTWTQNSGISYVDMGAAAKTQSYAGWFLDLVSAPATPTYSSLVRSSDTSGTVVVGPGNATSTAPVLRAVFVHGSTALGETALALRTTSATQSATGVVFHNDSASTINWVELSYIGEQWRKEANSVHTRLDFQYKVVSSFNATDYHIWADTGWTDADTLDFVAPVVDGVAANLTGNADANSRLIYESVPLTLAPGQYLAIRWLYASANSNAVDGHVLAIDDLYIHFSSEADTFFAPPQYFDDVPQGRYYYSAGNLGSIYSAYFPWLYHSGLGWVYGEGRRGDYFFYTAGIAAIGWVYTTNDIYPYVYDYSANRWLYQDQSVSYSPWFWDFSQDAWVEIY